MVCWVMEEDLMMGVGGVVLRIFVKRLLVVLYLVGFEVVGVGVVIGVVVKERGIEIEVLMFIVG